MRSVLLLLACLCLMGAAAYDPFVDKHPPMQGQALNSWLFPSGSAPASQAPSQAPSSAPVPSAPASSTAPAHAAVDAQMLAAAQQHANDVEAQLKAANAAPASQAPAPQKSDQAYDMLQAALAQAESAKTQPTVSASSGNAPTSGAASTSPLVSGSNSASVVSASSSSSSSSATISSSGASSASATSAPASVAASSNAASTQPAAPVDDSIMKALMAQHAGLEHELTSAGAPSIGPASSVASSTKPVTSKAASAAASSSKPITTEAPTTAAAAADLVDADIMDALRHQQAGLQKALEQFRKAGREVKPKKTKIPSDAVLEDVSDDDLKRLNAMHHAFDDQLPKPVLSPKEKAEKKVDKKMLNVVKDHAKIVKARLRRAASTTVPPTFPPTEKIPFDYGMHDSTYDVLDLEPKLHVYEGSQGVLRYPSTSDDDDYEQDLDGLYHFLDHDKGLPHEDVKVHEDGAVEYGMHDSIFKYLDEPIAYQVAHVSTKEADDDEIFDLLPSQ